jgi:hypothetical protein
MRKMHIAAISTVTSLLFLSVRIGGKKSADEQTQTLPAADVLSAKLAKKKQLLSQQESPRNQIADRLEDRRRFTAPILINPDCLENL